MKKLALIALAVSLLFFGTYPFLRNTQFGSCVAYALGSFLEVAQDPSARFLGKVHEDTARCRGGDDAVKWRATPWVDWQRYRATGGEDSRSTGLTSKLGFLSPNTRGVTGALLDMEYQRIELLQFNLFDNHGTFEAYVRGRNGTPGPPSRLGLNCAFPWAIPLTAPLAATARSNARENLYAFAI